VAVDRIVDDGGHITVHEAGAVGRAIEGVIHDWPPSRTQGQLELEIRDATRAEAEAVAFHASAILADRGLPDVTFSVSTQTLTCALCGTAAAPSPANPSCDACGAPLPQVEGPAVVCREVTPCA
jgi:hypothetical protein